ncbi:Protein of unknown function (DUF802) [Acidovorax sp. CF316]|uniref:DUF802 domain-containing protein n=1 Tax=Acidovorax sp. CF316 TaxID=1144317 RepID=UPI00026BCAF2|nr:DUF802 domain-containing protein [Acidovorax sp. CF316]EJE53430.1 Protein of unknown function (DUF802) [Acidovorax sp. CF316]
MNKSVMAGVFAAGLAVAGWVAWGFVGTSPLALAMTAVIAAVYLLGAYELQQFRSATGALARALADVPVEPQADLAAWLERLPPALRHPVRQRIEGERVALPGPALAPYLVGLLVMLGMLGTFLGMVVTFQGAVFALEASSNLDAIRAALAAPIKGLGLAFGTSVAGVATSAMLGLMSALARRERLQVLRLLDTRIATLLRPFSAAHKRDGMFAALQTQAQAMPLIAERLQNLMEGLERRHGQLNEQLVSHQQGFHREAATAYTALASTVGASLQDSLAASARQAGDSIRPVVEQAMAALAQEAERSHLRLREATDAQLQALSAQWEGTARQVAATWTDALHSQRETQGHLVTQLDGALQTVAQGFEQRTGALLGSLRETVDHSHAAQAAADQQRLEGWNRSMEGTASALTAEWQRAGERTAAQQREVGLALAGAAAQLDQTLQAASQAFDQRAGSLLASLQDTVAQSHASQAQADQQRLEGWNRSMEGMAGTLADEWQRAGAQTAEQQRAAGQALEGAATQLERALQAATQSFEQRASALLASLQDTVAQSHAAQVQTDQQRLEGWNRSMEGMAGTLVAEWQRAGTHTVEQQRAVGQALEGAATQLDRALQAATQSFEQRASALLASLQDTVAQSHTAQVQADQQRLETWSRSMEGMAGAVTAELQRAGAQAAEQQQGLYRTLEGTATQLTERMSGQVEQTLGSSARLMEQSDALLRTRVEAEARWEEAQGERMDSLTAVWRTELAALRDDEAARGQAAVERLDALQAAVAGHLATLGSALEAPLTRLLQTASDVPQAAAEVITQLRQEMTRLGERDNLALEERTAMMEQLATLLHSVNEAAVQQRAAIESLVGSAAQVLEQAGQQFSEALGTQAGKVDEVAVHVAASAVELASLGESFSHGVGLFTASNDKLLQGLQGIESAIGQSLGRSDEQLAYYVAQAREVIDLSISSQQGIVEDLRRLHGQAAATASAQGVAA